MSLLKGVAVGYDAVYDRFTETERIEIRDTLARIGKKYFGDWFNAPAVTGAHGVTRPTRINRATTP